MLSRRIALVVALVTGFLVLLDFFVVQDYADAVGHYLIHTASIVAACALLLGLTNVARVHLFKIGARGKGWPYSLVLLLGLLGTLAIGFIGGGPASLPMQRLFDSVLFPLQATLFSLLAFFVFVAAYRSFRVRDFESGLFVVFALIVLLGQTPVGAMVWDQLPVIKDWVFDVPALAGMRGILMGVALGTIATGLRILMGVDRPYSD